MRREDVYGLDARLIEWGMVYRSNLRMMGLPENRIAKGMKERSRAPSKPRRFRNPPTAQAHQHPLRCRLTQVTPDAEQIEAALVSLPNWAKRIIERTYLRRMPDRLAARALNMGRHEYVRRRERAIEEVAERIARAYIPPKPNHHSAVPSREG